MASSTIRRVLLQVPGFEAACRRLTRGHPRVLMYHRFTDDPAAAPEALPRAVFARQLDLAAAHADVVGPDEVVARQEGRRDGGRPQVMITVDDGYRDFHDHAFPELRRRGMPAVLFVTTGFVDGRVWMWWDKVTYLLEAAAGDAVTVRVAGRTLAGRLRDHADRRAFWSRLVPALRFVADGRKEEVIADLAVQLGVDLPARCPPAYAASSWEEIAAMADQGIVMGAHTRTHPILSRVDRARARDEILGSRDDLAERLGRPVRWFAYPQGGPADYDETTLDVVAEAGFARTWVAHADPSDRDDLLRSPRYCVGPDLEDFRWIVCGAEHLVLRLKSALGLRTGVSHGYWTGSDLAAALNADEGADHLP